MDNQKTVIPSREAVGRFLDGRINYERARCVPYNERELKLHRMRELLAHLGNPQQHMPIIHVAGTKGKGSTTAMLGAILSAAGYRTGVFTSPHLDRIEQRMAIDGQPCPSAELVDMVTRLVPVVDTMDREAAARGGDEIGPTYFELATALALMHFAHHRVQVAVLEVGLGGRLDSTNVCQSILSLITSISFDHTRQLGDTLESIAREKAGIVKPTVPVVSGVVDPAPRQVIRDVCHRQGCRLVELGVDFDFDYQPPRALESAPAMGRFSAHSSVPDPQWDHRDLALRLLGHHQAANAAVALAAVAELQHMGWEIPEQAIRNGLTEVVWPARIELLARRPAVIIDSAHNPASIDALLQVLDESFSVDRRLLIFATSYEKDTHGMFARLLGRFDEAVFTQYLDNPRAVPPEELSAIAAEVTGRQYHSRATPAEAWDHVRTLAAPDDLICATGSFFLAAELRRMIVARANTDHPPL